MIGQTISQYRILVKLGEGGMGVVYKAQDTKLDRVVALKFLPQHVAGNEEEQLRFQQEAKAVALLNHPNVCTIYDIREEDGQQFISMEFVDGVTLRQKIATSKLKESDALAYAVQIGDALQEAHGKGIVHRDVKVENIMVNTRNQIKVMDFGLAKLKGSLRLTKTSSTVGTLAYMAPEQIQGGEVDARSDIFSFGIVLYEMLTGVQPFRGEHEAAVMYSILNQSPESPSSIRPVVPPDVDRIVHRALEKDPDDRYQHVDDMVSELRRVMKQTSRVIRAQADPALGQLTPNQVASVSGSDGMRGHTKNRLSPRTLTIAGVVAAGVLIAVYFLFLRRGQNIDSLAVLPFVNEGSDSTTEYLSDGMTESIINSLTRIPGLRVIPRSTVFRFKGKDIDPQEVGSKLNVKAVLSGRIVHRGDGVNLQLDLIDVANQSQIYGNQYQRSGADILSMQDEIVGDVVKRLGVSLSKEQEKTVNKRYTENVEAYKLYLQGRFAWNKRSASEINKAIGFFNQAIAVDPTYALAYVGLADSYMIQEQYAGLPGRETSPKALAAASRALALDNSLAEAHTSAAFASIDMWDWKMAEREFNIAFSLNPNYATSYHWYSILLYTLGRPDEAFKAIKRAEELDPLSIVIGINVAIGYSFRKDYRRAIEKFDALIAMDSTFSLTYSRKAGVLLEIGKNEEAYALATKGAILSQRSADAVSFLGLAAAACGRRNEAIALAQQLERRYTEHTSTAYCVARVYAGLGDQAKAFQWLETGVVDRSRQLIWLIQDSAWKQYHSNPRYRMILKQMGLEL